MQILIFFSLFLIYGSLSAREITIKPFISNQPLVLHKAMLDSDHTVQISTFKVYVCSITDIDTKVHLLELEQNFSFTISDVKQTLMFGIDSNQTVNTTFSDALDPIHGMFWTWNAGYINCKIEGIYTHANNVITEFQLHLGGYRFPDATSHVINIPKGKKDIQIEIDIKPALDQMMKEGKQRIMIPGKDAKVLSDLLYSSIRISN
ncbi:MAG: MbnP family protein [Candidatus Kapaibacteriota bacterium]